MPRIGYCTSPGGRVVASVAAVLLLPMALGAMIVAADAFDGVVTIRMQRGGQMSFDGWTAYLYGAGLCQAGLGFVLIATTCAAAAALPGRIAGRTLPLPKWGFIHFASAAAPVGVATVAEVMK